MSNKLISWFANVLRTCIVRPLIENEIRHFCLMTPVVFGPANRLKIAPTAMVIHSLFNTNSGTITIEDYVFFSHNVSLITGTHDIAKTGPSRMMSTPLTGRDIVVKRGAWIGINAVILGPCVIGENAVVAAGAVVTDDVPSDTVVGGVPARIIKKITPSNG